MNLKLFLFFKLLQTFKIGENSHKNSRFPTSAKNRTEKYLTPLVGACILPFATMPPTVYYLCTKDIIHGCYLSRSCIWVWDLWTRANLVSGRLLMNDVTVVLPEIMKTLTKVQAIGMARRTKMNLLIACCVQNERDGEVNEDPGVFILHDKWVGFPYIQKYCKKRRLWKDGRVLSVGLSSSRLWKVLITLLKMYFRSVASWLESTALKDENLSSWSRQSSFFSLSVSYTFSYTLTCYQTNMYMKPEHSVKMPQEYTCSWN